MRDDDLQVEYNDNKIERICTVAREAEKNMEKRWQRKFI